MRLRVSDLNRFMGASLPSSLSALSVRRMRSVIPDQFLIRDPLSRNLRHHLAEAPAVAGPALIEAECLLVEIAAQVHRIDADVGAFECTLQPTPEVLDVV